ncbi:hypothetical protein BM477_03625 [Boudabousia marimammalium]|uniref:WYL domain-containing protein n=1 Tax=Boudabousia marimammalium TaxID=156892 RepID=A0A1Q5PRD8_9ACTO|nr:hypothetical protein BM477_03625 [Boudabousia marimammalium]
MTLRQAQAPGLSAHQLIERVSGYGSDFDETTRKLLQRDRQTLEAANWRIIATNIAGEIYYRASEPDTAAGEVALTASEAAYLASLPQLLPADSDWKRVKIAVARLLSQSLVGAQDQDGQVVAQLTVSGLGSGISHLPDLQLAFQRRATATFGYLSRNESTTRRVDIWGIWPRQGAVYLVGYDHLREAKRTFRLSRITTPVSIGESSSYQLTDQQRETEPLEEATISPRLRLPVSFAPEILQLASSVKELDGGGELVEISLPAAPLDYWLARLAEYANHLQIMEPVELRNEVNSKITHLRAILVGEHDREN